MKKTDQDDRHRGARRSEKNHEETDQSRSANNESSLAAGTRFMM